VLKQYNLYFIFRILFFEKKHDITMKNRSYLKMGKSKRIFVVTLLTIIYLSLISLDIPFSRAQDTKPTIWVTIYKIQGIDTIEGPLEGDPDWFYKIEVWNGEFWVDILTNDTVGDGILSVNNTHAFRLDHINSSLVNIHITLFEEDTFITISEVADISGDTGYVGENQRIPPPYSAKFKSHFNLTSNNFVLTEDPFEIVEEGYFMTSGEMDGSYTTDENDAELWFVVLDNYEAPVADAGPDQTVRTHESVIFDASRSNASEGSTFVKYQWDLDGDGNFDAKGSKIEHIYEERGIYNVTLRVLDSIGNTDFDVITVNVLNHEPIVSFYLDPTQGTVEDPIYFYDNSTDLDGQNLFWVWEFGDGSISTQKNSIHTYTDKGIFTVTLTVTDNEEGQASRTMQINIINLPPKADFLPPEGVPNVRSEVQFTDTSVDPEGKALTYYWEFGDGDTSEQRNPVHIYSSSGTMNVRLTVTDDEGESNTKTRSLTVFPNVRPLADFLFSPEDASINDVINFLDRSIDEDGYVEYWEWDFGDGSTSIQPDTDHKYSDKGSFYATLTVTDNDGNQDAVTKIITIKNLSPTADFTVSSTEVEIDETVQFTDKSSDPEEKTLLYQWEFGDGLSSTQRNPQHDYSEPGQYTVELTVTDDERATNTKSIMIEVEETQDGDGFRIPGFPYASIALGIILVVITLGYFKKNSFL
jgi:PKD repeat protein